MKTGLRNLSYAIIIFTSIYSFFAEQIIGTTSTYNYSIVLNILNISNIFNMAYGSFGNYIWNLVIPFGLTSYTISFEWLHLALAYFTFPFFFIANFLIAIGYFISITFSIITLPFSVLPLQVNQFFSTLIAILFIISIITSIQILATSIRGDE